MQPWAYLCALTERTRWSLRCGLSDRSGLLVFKVSHVMSWHRVVIQLMPLSGDNTREPNQSSASHSTCDLRSLTTPGAGWRSGKEPGKTPNLWRKLPTRVAQLWPSEKMHEWAGHDPVKRLHPQACFKKNLTQSWTFNYKFHYHANTVNMISNPKSLHIEILKQPAHRTGSLENIR